MSQVIHCLPFEIAAPGLYILEGDLSGPAGEYSLKVTAPAVTVDLAGHTLASQADIAILLCAAEFSLKNGTLKAEQLALAPEPHVRADHCVLENLRVQGGLFVGGQHLYAKNCVVQGGTYGIKADQQARLQDCEVSECLLGIEVGAGSTVQDCRVQACEEGVYAYGARELPSHLERVIVIECQGLGLRLDGPGVLERCEAHNNGLSEPAGGILAGPATLVKECEAYGNQGGDIGVVEPCELSENLTSDGSGR